MTKRVPQKMPPIHPGEILQEDFMKPARLTAHRLAMALHVPSTRIAEIVHERACNLCGHSHSTWTILQDDSRFWLNLQTAYDLEIIEDDALAQIEREVRAGLKGGLPSKGYSSARSIHPSITP